MKTKRTMKSIAAAALALSLVAVPAAQNAVLTSGFSFGILANAEAQQVSDEADLRSAIAAGGEIKVTGTVTLSSKLTIDSKNVTIDLSEGEITANGAFGSMISITGTSEVTVNGGTLNGGNRDHYVIATTNGTNVTLSGVTVVNNSGAGNQGDAFTKHSIIDNYGTMVLDGTNVTSEGNAAAVKCNENSTTTIKGGSQITGKNLGLGAYGDVTLEGGAKVSADDGKAINAFSYISNAEGATAPITLTVKDAEVDGAIAYGVFGADKADDKVPAIEIGAEATLINANIAADGRDANTVTGIENTAVTIDPAAKITLAEGVELPEDTAFAKGLESVDVARVTIDGEEKTVIGGALTEALDNAEGEVSVEVINAPNGITVPEGVTVTNSTGGDIVVNDVEVKADSDPVTAVDPAVPANSFTAVAKVEATCVEDGCDAHYKLKSDSNTEYTKYILVDDVYTIADESDLVISKDTADHVYAGQPVEYTWSENSDGTKVCTATITCANSNGHTLNIPAYGIEVITKPATTEEEGSKYYKATFTVPEGVTGVTLTDQTTDPEAIAKLPITEAEKTEAIKTAVAAALNGLTVTNATTKADVETAVNAAVAKTGITDISVTTAFTITLATEESAGTAQAVVTVGTEQVKHDYSIAKLPALTPEPNPTPEPTPEPEPTPVVKTDAEKLAEVKKALDGITVTSELKFSETDNGNEIIKIINIVLDKAYDSDVRATAVSYGEPDSDNQVKYTVTLKLGDVTDTMEMIFKFAAEEKPAPTPAPAPVVTYYTVGFTGDYTGSGITVSSYRNTAGSVVTVNVPVGYEVSVISGGSRIAAFSDGTGTFTMPSGNVTLNVTSYLGALTSGYKNAYIYSYDSGMNHIKTNSVRGGMTSSEGEVTVKLGSEYAGKSVTLYNGRKSTSSKVDEAVLDSKGQAAFTVKSGKNYTLVVE
ncbi:MAG: hypothetical protein K2K57_04080 [Oscillospiraceae bacterium]|nr:hypothetical protein [Oscillospiraceae bacterium]